MKIAFLASSDPGAQQARDDLGARYGQAALETADVVVALGGDGLMLDTLHRLIDCGARETPVYGMHRGSIGFLMNDFNQEGLIERLLTAQETRIAPLRMIAEDADGARSEALAINEVSLLRETRQAAKLRISVDGAVRLEELICDGALVATPAGSTAYNLSAHGPILPIGSELLALTPISAFRPRRWRGALLPGRAEVRFEALEAGKRPVSAVADAHEVRGALRVSVRAAPEMAVRLLFDSGHNLDERILREQFLT